MSAFLVTDTHINALVTVALGNSGARYWDLYSKSSVTITTMNAQSVGKVLMDENVRSVTHRYAHIQDHVEKCHAYAESYRFRKFRGALSVAEVAKACDCYSYQACETDDWQGSQAYLIIAAIREHVSADIPGWDKAPWGIDEEKLQVV